MATFVLAWVLGGEVAVGGEAATPRPFHVIHADIREALRDEARAERPAKRVSSVHDLVGLHRELLAHPRYEESDTLQAYRAKVWSRLRRVKRQLEIEIARDARQRRDDPGAANADQDDPADADERRMDETYATWELASHLQLVGDSLGGPARVIQQEGAAGGRAVSDYGPDLVDLIERTINPDFWDTNGGPGTIVYYAPLRVLVVRATAEVHQRIGGAIGGLRAAGN